MSSWMKFLWNCEYEWYGTKVKNHGTLTRLMIRLAYMTITRPKVWYPDTTTGISASETSINSKKITNNKYIIWGESSQWFIVYEVLTKIVKEHPHCSQSIKRRKFKMNLGSHLRRCCTRAYESIQYWEEYDMRENFH